MTKQINACISRAKEYAQQFGRTQYIYPIPGGSPLQMEEIQTHILWQFWEVTPKGDVIHYAGAFDR